MDSETTLKLLCKALPDLKQRFALVRLGVFGSVARNEAGPDSDVDILAEFEGPATLDGFMNLKAELERLLGARVDLATPKSLRPALRTLIEKDLRDVA